jgi:hypothetical protein
VTPEERGHLLSVYAVEREDDHGALLLGFTMATAAFTYMIAAVVYIYNLYFNNQCAAHPTAQPLCGSLPWIQLVAPAIPVAVVGFLVLNTAATRMRSVHLQHLEAALKKPLSDNKQADLFYTPYFHTDAGIVWRPDSSREKNPFVQSVFAAISFVVYGIINGGIVLFTWVVLAAGGWTAQKRVAGGLYGVIELLEMTGFLVPIWHERFRYRKSQNAPSSDAPTTDPAVPTPRGRGILLFIWSTRPSASSSTESSPKP